MGCWNGTCGLTQLPIKDGDPVVVFILKNNEYHDRTIYNCDDKYYNICVPIFGEYNDYGSIENATKDDITLKYLQNLIGNFSESDIPQTLEEAVTYIETGDISNITFMMVHRKLYENLVKEMGNRKPYKENYTFRELSYNSFKEEIELIKQLNKFQNISKDSFKDIDYQKQLLKSHSDFDFFKHMKYFVDKVFIQDNDNLLNNMLDLFLFSIVMEYSRKLWMPQNGAGSQCMEQYLHKIMADYIIEKNDDSIKEYNEVNNENTNNNDINKETIFYFKDEHRQNIINNIKQNYIIKER